MALDENFKIDLPEKDIAKEAPIFVRGQVEHAIKSAEDRLNTMDMNKDGKADIGQLAGILGRALPLLILLNDSIDFEKAAEHAAELPFVKDKTKFAAALKQAGALAEHAGELFPVK